MALAQINIGAAANDGTGDTLRAAFGKVNDGFSAVDALTVSGVRGASHFSLIHSALDAGQDACLQIIGDSTSDETNEWAYLLGQSIAAAHPGVHARYLAWNPTLQDFNAPVVVQAGGGQRGVTFNASQGRRWLETEVPTITGDIDLRCECAAANWASGAEQAVVARYGSAGSIAYALIINTDGKLRLRFSVDGTAALSAVSTSAVPFTAGQTGHIRATLAFSGGNYTAVFYSSSDGQTWTSLGGPAAATGASLFAAASRYVEIGGRTGGSLFTGTIYGVQIRSGVNGQIVNPQGMKTAFINGDADTNTEVGGPTLYIMNASEGGTEFAYWSNATRFPLAVRPFYNGAVIVSHGLNTTQNVGQIGTKAAFETLAALVEARVPGLPPIYLTQNPKTTGTVPPNGSVQINASLHAQRNLINAAVALKRGWAVIDTLRAFYNDSRGLAALIEPDYGLHPNTTGGRALEGAAAAAPFTARKTT